MKFKFKNLKKIAAAFLAGTLAVGGMVVPAAADYSKALTAAMTIAKTRVDIPKEYTEFDYAKQSTPSGNCYTMTWQTKNGDEWLKIGVIGDVIIGYESYLYNDAQYGSKTIDYNDGVQAQGFDSESFGFAKLSAGKIIDKATEYLNMLNPEAVTNEISVLSDTIGISTENLCAQVNLQRMHNGIEVFGDTGEIVINKNSGELLAYGLTWTRGIQFKSNETAITQKEAQEAYGKNIGLKPIYRKVSSYGDATQKTVDNMVLLYVPENTNYPIDAFTGEISTFEERYRRRGWSIYYAANMNSLTTNEEAVDDVAEDGGAAGGISWSESELAEIEKTEKLLSTADVVKLFQDDEYVNLPANVKISDSYLSRDSFDEDKYYWSLSLKSGETYFNISCSAKDGELLSYQKSTNNSPVKVDSDAKKAAVEKVSEDILATADKILAKYNAAKTAEYRLLSSEIDTNMPMPLLLDNSTVYGYNVTYARYVNDIEVESDIVTINFDTNGKLKGYNINYTENVKFPSAKNIMTEKEALNALFKQKQMFLSYEISYDDDNNFSNALLFSMENGIVMNAKTGKLTDWEGTDKVENSYEYSDIDENKNKNMINKLKQHGIGIAAKADGTLSPDSLITPDEYIALLRQIGCYVYIPNNTSGEKTVDYIYKRDAVKYYAQSKYDNNILSMSNIFKSMYSDVKEGDEYIGFINAAKTDGFVTSKTSEKFYPRHKLTRIEALKMIYNYFTN